MASGPQPARASILLVRPSSVFSGLWAGLARSDPVGFAVSLAGSLAIFMPLFLSNVLFRLTLTWTTHEVCTWITVGILCVMIVVLLACMLFVKWPTLPADPQTIAGRLSYVCDSSWLSDLQGLFAADQKEREKRLGITRKKYYLGKVVGEHETSVGIECT